MGYLTPQEYIKLGLPIGALSASGDNFTYSGLDTVSANLTTTGSTLSTNLSLLSGYVGFEFVKINNLETGISGVTDNIILNNFNSGDLDSAVLPDLHDYKISNSGRYHLVAEYNPGAGIFINSSSGLGIWTKINLLNNNSNLKAAISENLQCITLIDAHPFGPRYFYTSRSSGLGNPGFSANFTTSQLRDVSMSSDGRNQIIVGAGIRRSLNSGMTWTNVTSPAIINNRNCSSVDTSSDFRIQALTDLNGQILISHNSGNSWFTGKSSLSVPGFDLYFPPKFWKSLKMSTDGKDMIAIVDSDSSLTNDYIYTSEDSGVTWSTGAFPNYWKSIGLSKFENNIFKFAVGFNAELEYYSSEEQPKLLYGKYNEEPWKVISNVPIELTGRNTFYEYQRTYVNTLGIGISKNSNVIGLIDNSTYNGYPPFFTQFYTGQEIVEKNQYKNYPLVYTHSNQNIKGIKNFTQRPTVNNTGVLLQGEATAVNVENIVYTTGEQTISGKKNFIAQDYIFSGVNIKLPESNVQIYSNTNLVADTTISGSGISLTISGVSYSIKTVLTLKINSIDYKLPLF